MNHVAWKNRLSAFLGRLGWWLLTPGLAVLAMIVYGWVRP